jgi:hypothetical protein
MSIDTVTEIVNETVIVMVLKICAAQGYLSEN